MSHILKNNYIFSTNTTNTQIKVTGWKTDINTNDFTVKHNEDTVELTVHISGIISVPANPSTRSLGKFVPASLAPKRIISSTIMPQPLGIISVKPDGDIHIGSTYGSAFNSSAECILQWSY